MKSFKDFVSEDGGGAAATGPANNAGSGNVKGFDPLLGQRMIRRKPIEKMIDAMTNPKKTKIDTRV